MKILWKVVLVIIFIAVILFIINEIQIVTNCQQMINRNAISAKLKECVKVYTFGGNYFKMSPIE